MSATVDTRRFNAQMRNYAATLRIEEGKVLRQQAGLLAKDLLKATPPFGKGRSGKGTFSQSFAEQRRIGRAAVRRDVGRAFVPMRDLVKGLDALDEKAKQRVLRYIRRKEFAKVQAVLRDLGMHKAAKRMTRRATLNLHARMRDRRGRVSDRKQPWLVIDRKTIAQVRKQREAHVGKWKGGWMASARKFGTRGVPSWISGHASGIATDNSRRIGNPGIRLVNPVRAETGRDTKIAKAAVQNRERGLVKSLQAKVEHARRKAGLAGG